MIFQIYKSQHSEMLLRRDLDNSLLRKKRQCTSTVLTNLCRNDDALFGPGAQFTLLLLISLWHWPRLSGHCPYLWVRAKTKKKLFLPTHTHIALNYFYALGSKDNHLCVHLSLKRLKWNIFVAGFQNNLELPFEIMREIFRENATRT